MISHPFSTVPYSLENLGEGQPWMGDPIPLNYMLYFFYNVHRFKVILGGSGAGAGIGLTTRQMQSPPQILNRLMIAEKAANAPDATQEDKDNYQKLKTKAESTPAPSERLGVLRTTDINTKCQYPVHSYSGNLAGVRLDFGSTRMIGMGMKIPDDRSIIPSYNRYSSPLFAPAAWGVLGDIGQLQGAYLVGYISLGLDDSGGYDISLYGTTSSDDGTDPGDGPGFGETFAQGQMFPRELFSDLVLSPSSGPTGTTVQIKVPTDDSVTDPGKMKCFSGFKNVKKVSFNGFNVTDSFSFQSENLGLDTSLNAQVVNESCSVEIPDGARSGYFTFYSESEDGKTCDQFTVPKKFTVTVS